MQLREQQINQPFAVVAVYILPHEEPAGGGSVMCITPLMHTQCSRPTIPL